MLNISLATILAVAGAAGVATAILAWLVQARRSAAQALRLGAAGGRVEALLTTAPGAYYAWSTLDGQEMHSPNLAAAVGLEGVTVSAFADLAPAFDADAYAEIERRIGALRGQGQAFSEVCGGAAGQRFALDGTAMLDSLGTPVAYVVWVRDMSRGLAPSDHFQQSGEVARTSGYLGEILDALPIPVWRRGESLDVTWWNKAFDDAVGGGGGPPEFASKPLHAQARALARKAGQDQTPQRETRSLVVDGERRAFDVVEHPCGGGLIGMARDITELVEVGGELERHIEAQADVLEKLNTATAIWGPDRRLKFFNRAYSRLFHLDENWLSTEPHHEDVMDAMHEKRRIPEQANFQKYKKNFMDMYTTVIEPTEEFMHLPDGSTLRTVLNPHPFGGLLFFYEDVSDRLELERSRNTLEAVQRATLDNLSQGVAVYGGDGRLKLYNKSYAELWSLSDEQLKAEPHLSDFAGAVHPLMVDAEDVPGTAEGLVDQMLARRPLRHRIETAEGRVLDMSTVPLPDGATLATFLDVTDGIRIERALRQRAEALEEADWLKAQFIANVSYELRTPLNTIGGFSEILSDQFFGKLNPRQAEYVDGIMESSAYLLALINDILDLATIEAGRMQLDTENFDVGEMVQSVLRMVEERVLERRLTLRTEVPDDIGELEGDERRIRQVVFNLLSNAIRFTSPGGTVTVGARRQDEAIVVWVSDTGRGIAEDEQEKVFAKFHRSAEATASQPGTGLGLALVKSFVELHGGTVKLTSKLGEGTNVTCVFPNRDSAGAAALAKAG